MKLKPRLLNILSRRKLLRAFAFRTGAIKWWWRYRHVLDGSYRTVPPEGGPIDPHRAQLWSLIAPLAARSLIEVGCGDGANLALFSRLAPAMRLSAIDVNPRALSIAKQRVKATGGIVGDFFHASASHIPVPNAFADIALSDAVFMYLPPSDALSALREMRRVASRHMLVHTLASDSLEQSTLAAGKNWVHNLSRLVAAAVPGARVIRYTSHLTSGQWGQFGAMYLVSW